MIQELIFTSASRGLVPGSMGFCTVAKTEGLPPNLAERLEALSGYRALFAPQEAKAHLNPISYSCLRISVGGRSYHVLSRIAPAGLDYSQRTNKLAHHIVLDDDELVPAGPAWLAATPNVFLTLWQGEPRILPHDRKLPTESRDAGICQTWQTHTGDAGWGGVLAETAFGNSPSQVTLIFKPGMDMLSLVGEALACLPPDMRWTVSFSTYYTKLPVGVECKWRCVVDGSPEAADLRSSPRHLVLDLSRPLGMANGGSLVELARSGVYPAVASSAEIDSELLQPLIDEDVKPQPAQRSDIAYVGDTPNTPQLSAITLVVLIGLASFAAFLSVGIGILFYFMWFR